MTPSNFGTSMGARPVAMQSLMPFCRSFCSASTVLGRMPSLSGTSVPSMSKKMILGFVIAFLLYFSYIIAHLLPFAKCIPVVVQPAQFSEVIFVGYFWRIVIDFD